MEDLPDLCYVCVMSDFIFCILKGAFIKDFQGGSQLTFTCSKSTTKTLEKGVKYVQSFIYLFICTLFIVDNH